MKGCQGCLILIGIFFVLSYLIGSLIWDDDSFETDPDDCYYSEPIPHYDECR